MSSEPVNLADEGDEPLWAGWYAGPVRGGGDRRRLQLCRGDEMVSLSVEELTRLMDMSGAVTLRAHELVRAADHGGIITWRPGPGAAP